MHVLCYVRHDCVDIDFTLLLSISSKNIRERQRCLDAFYNNHIRLQRTILTQSQPAHKAVTSTAQTNQVANPIPFKATSVSWAPIKHCNDWIYDEYIT